MRGILFVLKTGMQWNMLPSDAFGVSGVTCWRRMREGVVRYKRGRPKRKFEELYAGSAYVVTPCYKAVNERNMEARFVTKSRAGEHLGKKRWPVERTFAWFAGYRKIRIRDARQFFAWNALHQIAAFCIAWKQLLRFC